MTLSQSAHASRSGIRVRRGTQSVVGRVVELSAMEEAVEAARDGISGVILEGEPGIGKSRLLLAAAELAVAHEFVPAAVSADEEIRGPFMLARGLFTAESLRDGASDSVVAALDHACDLLSGRDDPGFLGLSAEDRLLRVIDQAAMGIRAAAQERPLALLLDDLQWADQDSLRLVRYVVRTQPALPVFFAIAIRPEEASQTPELGTLLADLDRMGIVRRFRVGRFRQGDTAELLRQSLDGPVAQPAVAAIQAQAEGVPFVIEELAKTYREAGLLQFVDGSWTLSPKAGRLVPSSVKTLVQRRAAHLREDTKGVLADAAILGRSFRTVDVCTIRAQLGQTDCTPAAVAELLEPAISAGLLGGAADRSGADYVFSHEQVHNFAASWLAPSRRRAIHGAIVDLLMSGDHVDPGVYPALARHALAAGDEERAARFANEASLAALAMNAPEEALRMIDDALAVVSANQSRVALLRIRDDAYDMLRRVDDRMEGLTELAALADAARDKALTAEVMLRRAAALRIDDQHDLAADLARRVRTLARERADEHQELAASVELGQDLLRSTLGEGYTPTPLEADFDGAEEAYEAALAIAERLGDRPAIAAVSRELGVIATARLRSWFVDRFKAGEHIEILRHVAGGGRLEDAVRDLPIMSLVEKALGLFQRALELYEELGDRRGAMSTIIAMAYTSWGPAVHVGANPAQRIEEIRRLSGRMHSLSVESERDAAEVQMLYGVHVFCRAKVIPDLAIERGREVHARARAMGDRALEFLAADGTAGAYLDVGNVDEAKTWLDRAAGVAASSPTPTRSRQVEVSRGLLAAASGDAPGMRRHFEQALQATAGQDRRAGRCEIVAMYALCCVRLADASQDDAAATALRAEAETRAAEAIRLADGLPGRPPWKMQAMAALAVVALERGDRDQAIGLARSVLAARHEAMREDPHLEILLPAARVMLASGEPAEAAAVRDELHLLQGLIGQRTLDGDVRARWFRGPLGRELSGLAGPFEPAAAQTGSAGPALDAHQQRLLGLLIEGRTNAEIAQELGETPELVALALAGMYAQIGASSRAEATVMALSGAV